MQDDSGIDLDLVDLYVSASTESENEGLPAATVSISAPTVVPTVTADRRAATSPALPFLPLPFLVPQTSDNLVTSVHG